MRTWLRPRPFTQNGPVLITGGAGFIGTNLADRIARGGRSVIVYDNLSRPGVERNITWLKREHGDRVRVEVADIRDADRLRSAVRRASQVFHFAAQVAVTTSLVDPKDDFTVNAGGTVDLLEAIRACPEPPSLVFTSTNKVYGELGDLRVREAESRYVPSGRQAVDESRALDFHSPYGCSKGAADQYVLDYSRSFGLHTTVFRMSCIYGPHQCGNEDQGWVAHFLIRALKGEPITIFGDGKQVRDILYVDDLVEAFLTSQAKIDTLAGRAFNIGGGPDKTVSLLELIELIELLEKRPVQVAFGPWRTGDQRFYVSDHQAFTRATGWMPRVKVAQGVARLRNWLAEEMAIPARAARGAACRASTEPALSVAGSAAGAR
jgi:CDP-paratose 2-epimerase